MGDEEAVDDVAKDSSGPAESNEAESDLVDQTGDPGELVASVSSLAKPTTLSFERGADPRSVREEYPDEEDVWPDEMTARQDSTTLGFERGVDARTVREEYPDEEDVREEALESVTDMIDSWSSSWSISAALTASIIRSQLSSYAQTTSSIHSPVSPPVLDPDLKNQLGSWIPMCFWSESTI